jgi:hypothetical protein
MPPVGDDEHPQKTGTRGDSTGRREAAKPSSVFQGVSGQAQEAIKEKA